MDNLKFNTQHKKKVALIEITPFILCSLYTLVPNASLFKDINLYYINNEIYDFLTNFTKIENLCNKKFVKKLAFIIIQPFLRRDFNTLNKGRNKQKSRERILLNKYLKRYRNTYYRFFYSNNYTTIKKLTKKEINTFAIKALFLIVGV